MKSTFGRIIFFIFVIIFLFGFTTTSFAHPNISGDFRLRHEIGNITGTTQNQNKVRVRLRLNGDIGDSLYYGVGLSTGNFILSDPNKKEVDIDLAYIRWDMSNDIKLFGGKIENTLYRVGNNELLWKDTFNPEGFAFQADKISINPEISFFVNSGYFILNESVNAKDSKLIGGQAGVVIDNIITVGVSHYYYNFSNNSIYEYFGELETYLPGISLNLLETYLSGISLTLYGDYITDNDSDSWIVGTTMDLEILTLFYNYRDVDYSVINHNFSDSDYAELVGINGGEGQEIGLGIPLMKNVKVQITYFTDSGFDDYKTQADLKINF